MPSKRDDILVLFDIDGTLTKPRLVVEEEMTSYLANLRQHISVGLVGGSDLPKAREQMGGDVVSHFDFVFPENGLVAFDHGKPLPSQSLIQHFGEAKLQKFINFVLKYFSELDIPVKRGNFIEFRTGMLNVSPIGRNCSQAEREAFFEYDKVSPFLFDGTS